MSETPETWLTQESFDRLQEEQNERAGERRAEIVKRIEEAREEGDLKENGGYHAAKEDQGKNEARIRQLKQILETAHIGTPPDAKEGTATHGTIVTVKYDDGDTETFLLGSREETALSDIAVYSPTSPLGAAVLGADVDSTVTYELPNGSSMSVQVVDVKLPH